VGYALAFRLKAVELVLDEGATLEQVSRVLELLTPSSH
jgi:transposase-like protein